MTNTDPYPFHREPPRPIAQVIFVAAPASRSSYRGEVLDARTYRTLLTTPDTYANESIARIAARRAWAKQQENAL